jgi:uncharacterized protein (DUF1810 family)
MVNANSSDSLARFRSAQSQPDSGYATALAEIRAGRKRSHWIWYIFPQIRGLGYSSMSARYAIASAAEAEAYLFDPVLGERLSEITRALEGHVCAATRPRSLDEVLGDIDAMKVVSSLTLFAEVARRLEGDPPPWVTSFRASADRVLDAAARAGRARCAFTLRELASPQETIS